MDGENPEEQLRQWLLAMHETARNWPTGNAQDEAIAYEWMDSFLKRAHEAALCGGELRQRLKELEDFLGAVRHGQKIIGNMQETMLYHAHALMDAYWQDLARTHENPPSFLKRLFRH